MDVLQRHNHNKFAISVIIPTYNEERYILDTLLDLSNQSFDLPFETIIVDCSTDSTIKVAKSFAEKLHLHTIKYMGKRGVSNQRNYGAKVAKSQNLLFIDADTRTPNNSLSLMWSLAIQNGYAIGTSYMKANSSKLVDRICLSMYNLYSTIRNPFSPIATGAFMYVNKEVFEKIGGFNPNISFAEDFDLVQRVRKEGYRQKLISTPLFKSSVRRLDELGRFNFFARTVYNGLVLLLPQKISQRLVLGYKLDGHSIKRKNRTNKI